MTASPAPTWPKGMYGSPVDLYARSALIRAGADAARSALLGAAQAHTGPDAAHWLMEQSQKPNSTAPALSPYMAALEHGNREAMFTEAQLHAHIEDASRDALTHAASLTSDTELAGWLLTRSRTAGQPLAA